MPDSLQIALKNDSDNDQPIWAYITGMAIQQGNKRCILQSDGRTLHFPSQPPAILSPLQADCAIPLGRRGEPPVTVTIPQMAGGRIWVARAKKLTFLLNPSDNPTGPALVEPSVLNPTDANAGVDFGFVELTLNADQLYGNISYVDFVPRLPFSITLHQRSGGIQDVAGMAPGGIARLAEALREQEARDGRPWGKLVVMPPDNGGGGNGNGNKRPLRILNATHAGAVGVNFDGYYEPYIDQVWAALKQKKILINTQAGPGKLSGSIQGGGYQQQLIIGGEPFPKPTTADILGCNSGPFTTGPSPVRNAIIPRLAAAFLRTAVLHPGCGGGSGGQEEHPSHPQTFYTRDPTNHYARLVHEFNVDKKGYAFAYDDVQPDGGEDQSGKVEAGDPELLVVTVGGARHAGGRAPPPPPPPGGPRPPPPPGGPRPGDEGGGGGGGGGPSSSQQQQQRQKGPPPPVPPKPKQGGVKGKLDELKSLKDRFF